MRVLIVDDHARVRRSVCEALQRTLAPKECGEADSAAEALRRIEAEPWDVVLLDLSLPDHSGLETLHELHRLRPGLPVVVMSMHPESQYGAAVRAAGAAAFLSKGSDPEVIAAAVREAVGARVPAAGEGRQPPWEGLARYLHDDLAQALAAVKINLQLARGAADPAELQRQVVESIVAIDGAIASVRRLVVRLAEDRGATP